MNRNDTLTAGRLRAFTLVEVVLAVSILSGMLLGVLSLYQRSANLRADLGERMDAVSGARLLMEHMTNELECALQHASFDTPLRGSRTRIEFLTTAPTGDGSSGGLRVVRYAIGGADDEEFEEDMLVEMELLDLPDPTSAFDVDASVESADGEGQSGIVRGVSRYKSVEFLESESSEAGSDETSLDTDAEFASGYELYDAVYAEGGGDEADEEVRGEFTVVSEQLRFLQFRYFDGLDWYSSWSNENLPLAVEITLAPSSEEIEIEDAKLRGLVFTRLVHLPAALGDLTGSEESDTDDSDSEDGDSEDGDTEDSDSDTGAFASDEESASNDGGDR